jgi:L-galactose dehydrogenase
MKLNPFGRTGLHISALGLGASPFGGVFGSVTFEECSRCLRTALDGGVNLIDTSPYYGLTASETMLGRCLVGIPRDQYLLATKVGRYGDAEFDFSGDRIHASIDESLQRLGLDHVDILQAHDIEFGSVDQVISETLPALREIVRAGKARFIGLTGLPMATLRRGVLEGKPDCIMSYCHGTLLDHALLDLNPVFEEHGTGVFNAAPLSMGLLSMKGPPSWHPAPPAVRDACRAAAELCARHGADLSHLALHHALQLPGVHCTVIGTANSRNMARNLEWAATPPPAQLLDEVVGILRPVHNVTWPSGRPENN